MLRRFASRNDALFENLDWHARASIALRERTPSSFPATAAVSYTHLDVYKRQLLIDTIAMIGSAAGRGAVVGPACLASAGGAAVSAVSAVATIATAAGAQKPAARTRVDRVGITCSVIPFLG